MSMIINLAILDSIQGFVETALAWLTFFVLKYYINKVIKVSLNGLIKQRLAGRLAQPRYVKIL